VLADIVVFTVGVGLAESLEASVWQVFLVLGPADTLGLEEVDQAGNVVW